MIIRSLNVWKKLGFNGGNESAQLCVSLCVSLEEYDSHLCKNCRTTCWIYYFFSYMEDKPPYSILLVFSIV